MPVAPPFDAPPITPNYWDFSTLSFDRSVEFPDNPEFWNAFPNDIQVYDINGDGHLDVVTIYSFIPGQDLPGIPIRVLLGDGHGGFTDGTSNVFGGALVTLGDAASGVSVADFNGDGVDDLFISQSGERLSGLQNALLLSDGHGGVVDVTATNLPQLPDFTHWSTASDVDGDGDIDIFVLNLGAIDNNRDVYFLVNDGSGNFTRSDAQLPADIDNNTRQYQSALLFDADNDGDKDLFLGVWGPSAVLGNTGAIHSLILFNDGTGHFVETAASVLADPSWTPSQRNALGVQAVDLNGDGYKDLVAIMDNNSGTNYVQILINDQAGGFVDETASRWPIAPQSGGGRYLHLADVNGDGALDIVLQTGAASRFFVNNGDGHFVALPSDFLFTNGGSYGFVPGDFNEDGHTDFFIRTIVNSWDDPDHVTEFDWIATWQQLSGEIHGDENDNAVLGGSTNDELHSDGGNDVMFGGGGDDVIYDSGGASYMNGGDGNDIVFTGAGDDIAEGRAGDDQISGDDGNDQLWGQDGNDFLDGGTGADTMIGGIGDDTFVTDNAGDVTMENPGEGTDTIQSSITWTLGAALENLTLTGANTIDGTGNTLNNLITGNDAANILNGKTGDDAINAGGGADTLYGGDGNDTLSGGVGADFLDGGNHNDALAGGDDNDTLYGRAGIDTLDGGLGADTMFGGAGDDTYVVDNASDVAAESSAAGNDTIMASVTYGLGAYIENLLLTGAGAINGTGNILANSLTGNDAANVLSGLAGFDTLNGMGGDDTLNGGNGNDTLSGGTGNDILDGGNDLDTLNGGDGADTLYGRTAADVLNGDAGNDTLYGGDGDDILNGGADNDLLDGGNHNDTLSGGDGDDTLYGRQNDDILHGDAGSDTLYGGDGNDTLNGGAGVDVINGGNGADTFVFAAGEANGDAIQDFNGLGAAAGDSIVFSGYGLAANGASFIQLDATHWQINSADGTIHETITLANGASVDPSDYVFGP